MKIIYSVLVGFLISSSVQAQSAWTKKKGESYIQAQFNTIPEYSEIFQDSEFDGELFALRHQTQASLNFYAEYGLTDKTTIISHIPVVHHTSGKINPDHLADLGQIGTESDLTALGNIELGIRHQLYNKSVVISAEFNTQLNTSTYQSESGLRSGYDAYSFRPTLNIGKGWNKSFLQGFTGLTLRTNDYHQSFNIGVEYGYKIHSKFWTIGFINGILNLKDAEGTLSEIDRTTYNYVYNQEYLAFGFKVIYDHNENFGFNLGFGGAFTAQYVAKSPSLAIGVYTKLK